MADGLRGSAARGRIRILIRLHGCRGRSLGRVPDGSGGAGQSRGPGSGVQSPVSDSGVRVAEETNLQSAILQTEFVESCTAQRTMYSGTACKSFCKFWHICMA